MKSSLSQRLGVLVLATSLSLGTTAAAYANPDRISTQLERFNERAQWRSARMEARELHREQRNLQHLQSNTTDQSARNSRDAIPALANINHPAAARIRNNSRIPGQLSPFLTSRPRSTFTTDSGNNRALTNGVSLDLTSTLANITVGENLLSGTSTIQVGNRTREVSAGSQVTAAEYAALTQVIATGSQSLVLTNNGAAASGSLDLNLVTDGGANIKASELVIPKDVTVSGDFARTADGVRITHDLVNYGSIVATSSNANRNTAKIGARDINNELGASISSHATLSNPHLNLSLKADRDLNNRGDISSAGDLELSAGNLINNSGTISAVKNVTLSGALDAPLTVNNHGGVISAGEAINIRTSDYAGVADSTVLGGDLLSKNLNIYAGQGTANVFVNELTGTVNTTGLAAHVSADTAELVLGEQCLTGDPTYFNTGNIAITGNVTVQEALAIVAGGNVTSNVSNLNITANSGGQGFDILIVAGADVSAIGPTSPSGPIAGNPPPGAATAGITFRDPSTTGGNIDFSAANNLTINAQSTSGNNAGGNVLLAAFSSNASVNGNITLASSSTINASGSGTGDNGNVTALAGRAIQLGQIDNAGGSGANNGNVTIENRQPVTSDGQFIVINTAGQITSGNTLVPGPENTFTDVTVGAINTNHDVRITSSQNLTVDAVGTSVGHILMTARGDLTFSGALSAEQGILMVASGNIMTAAGGSSTPSITTNSVGNAGSINLVAGASFAVGNIVQIPFGSGVGGTIDLTAGVPINGLSANSTVNGNGGVINLIAYSEIRIPTAVTISANMSGGASSAGDITLVAGAESASAVTVGGISAAGGVPNGSGSIRVVTSVPNATLGDNIEYSLSDANFGEITNGSWLNGPSSLTGGVTIGGTISSAGGNINLFASANGVQLQDVENFGQFKINTSGAISVQGGATHSISSNSLGIGQLLWTANGNISFDSEIKVFNGGAITLVSQRSIQSVDDSTNPGTGNPGLDASSITNGGNISVIAGVTFFNDATGVTINGLSNAGGSINFDGTAVGGFTGKALSEITTTASGIIPLNGGNVNLIANGSVLLDDNMLFNVAGVMGGQNGTVNVVASETLTPPTVNFGGRGGALNLRAADPSTNNVHILLNGTIDSGTNFMEGPLVATPINYGLVLPFSSFTEGVSFSIATLGNIVVNLPLDLNSNTSGVNGGSLFFSGANVQIGGAVDTSGFGASGIAGDITIETNSATAFNIGGAGPNSVGTLTANAATSGNGAAIRISNAGTGGINVLTAPTATVTNGNGGTLVLDAGTGNLDITGFGGTISRNGAGANFDGGEVSLVYNTLSGTGGGFTTITANAAGGASFGGFISVQAGGNILIDDVANGLIVSTNGLEGRISLSAGGTINQIETLLTATGNLTLTAGSDVTLTTSVFSRDVKVSSGGIVTAVAIDSVDSTTLLSTGNMNLNGNLSSDGGVLIIAGGNITTSVAGLVIDTTDVFNSGGNVFIAAGAGWVDNGSSVNIIGSSGTGGNVLFNTGGSLNRIETSSGNGASGDVTILAYHNNVGTGGVVLPAAAQVITRSSTGPAGDVVMVGGAASGTGVFTGSIDTSFNSTNNGTGSITLRGATPSDGGAIVSGGSDTGSYSGSFATGGIRDNSVTAGSLTTAYAPVSVVAGTVSVGNVNTSPFATTANGGNVLIASSGAGSLTVGQINANGSNTGSGGIVQVLGIGGGGFSIQNISANSGVNGGNAGSIIVTANIASPLTLPVFSAAGLGAGSSAGTIEVRNLSGGIDFDPSDIVLTTNGAGGNLSIRAEGGAFNYAGGAVFNMSAASSSFAAGSLLLAGTSISFNGSLTIIATNGLAGTGMVTLETEGGDVSTNGSDVTITTSGNVVLNLGGGEINTSGIIPGDVIVSAGGDIIDWSVSSIDTHATAGNNNGGDVILTAGGSIAVGDVDVLKSGSGLPGALQMTANNGGITFGNLYTNGAVSLSTSDGDIIGVSIQGELVAAMNGSSPGDITLTGVSNIPQYSGAGAGGLVTINNGNNPITIQNVGSGQSLNITTTNSASGISIGNSPWTTTGTVVFNAPRFSNGESIQAASFTIQNLAGDLTVVGGNGTMTGTTPAAGAPGSPSNPTAINFNTALGANLNLFGNLTFNGDVTLLNPGGTTTSNTNSLFAGNNNVILNTVTWTQVTNGNITGNLFTLAGVSLINSDGDVTLTGNLTFSGRDLAIVARNNINLLNFNLDTSSSTGDAGDITMIAGYNVTPSSGGQNFNPSAFTITTPSTGGGNITGTGTINLSSSAATGNGGNLLVIASGLANLSNGIVSLGAIDTSADNGNGGSVTIIGSGGITTGDITSTGVIGGTGGNVIALVGTPSYTGTPIVENGVLSGATFIADTFTARAITVGDIDTGNASINLVNDGPTITTDNTLVGHEIIINTAETGTIILGTDTIAATADINGDGGVIQLRAATVNAGGSTLSLNAAGTTGAGGSVSYVTSETLTLSQTGDLVIDASGATNGGAATVTTTGDLTVDATGVDVSGSNGNGGQLVLRAGLDGTGTLTLNSDTIFDGTNAVGSGDGGSIYLSGQFITFQSDINNPFELTANSVGAGVGGSIIYESQNTNTTVFGAPAKPPKDPVDYLLATARASGANGDGGEISVKTAGSIIIDDTDTFDAGSSGNGDGAQYTIEAGNASGKAGALIINGALTANGSGTGDGGSITLISDNKASFDINTGKTPKNGVSGILSTGGTTKGTITVRNRGGGIGIETSAALNARTVDLEANLKGSISTGKEVVISADQTLSMVADQGNVGKKDMLVNAPELFLFTNAGTVSVSNGLNGLVTLADGSAAGKSFTLKTLDDVILNGITTGKGAITITSQSGLMTVADAAHLNAANAGLLLNVLSLTDGEITIGDDATVETSGKGKNVVIAIGQAPKKGVNTTPPTGGGTIVVTPDPSGKGNAYFDPQNGVFIEVGDTATINPRGKNVIFSNLSTNANLITLGNNVTVTADPPLRIPSPVAETFTSTPGVSVQNQMIELKAPTLSFTNASIDFGNLISANTNLISMGTVSGITAVPVAAGGSGGITQIVSIDGGSSGITQIASAYGGASGALPIASAHVGSANAVTTDENDLFIDAAFHSEKNADQSSFSIEKQNVAMTGSGNTLKQKPNSERHILTNGNVVFAPTKDTTVETPHGTVEIKAGAIALIMQSKDGLAIYNLHDQNKNSVVLSTANKKISLTPGRHTLISSRSSRDFASVNPIELVQYRGLSHSKLDNGWSLYTSEFSIPSACYAVKPLRSLVGSKHQQAVAMTNRMLKTTAILMTLSPDRGDFVQHFKSQVTAMN